MNLIRYYPPRAYAGKALKSITIERLRFLLLFFVPLCCFLYFYEVSSVYADEITYNSGGRRDPFVALVGPNGIIMKKMHAADVTIEGIIYDPSKGSMALINGELYKKGDTVKGSTIKEIFKDKVILIQDDEEKTILLREELVNRT